MKKETGTVLLFNFTGTREREIISLCKNCGLRVIRVAPAEFHETIGTLLMRGGSSGSLAAPVQAAFSEEMMVIGSDRNTLEALLAGFRERELKPVALKAMVTAVNISWTSAVLQRHLKEEHERMHRSLGQAVEEKTDEP